MAFLCFISNYHLPVVLLVLMTWLRSSSPESEEYRTYIIHMDYTRKPDSFSTHESWHQHTLNSLSDADNQENLVYSYSHVMHGFSARLTASQLAQLESSPAHRATFEDSFCHPLTTRTPKFLGLNKRSGIWPESSYGKDVIIGLIDTGVWPESESFNDKGMPPVPERWKGECENGTAFSRSNCNRKLIGARSFNRGLIAGGRTIDNEVDYNSARDYSNGHGTHTASTAAGNHVLGVSHFGYASGMARGIAPGAHIAVYKVLWATSVIESALSDVLAGMDQAIADGVDIISLSLGNPLMRTPYFEDVIAIGALSAIEKGIFVVCAAGNFGPGMNTVKNGAPWVTTVGAGTLDRTFVAKLKLGNGLGVEGISYFPQSVYITNISLHYNLDNSAKKICNSSSLDPKEVTGKVVVCDGSNQIGVAEQILEVQRAGATAGVFLTDEITYASPYKIPSLLVRSSDAAKLREYAKRKINPMVKSMKFVITRTDSIRAPEVANFSSRGPDPINPGILKPDILAPGFDILAAVVPIRPFMKSGTYDLVTDYALFSGTSMAAPHIAGVAALVKGVHQDWSPAAIRSALMTTAYIVDNKDLVIHDQSTKLPATPLDFGAGHVNPNKAADPGLIYDADFQDYIEFICGFGYSKNQMSALIRKNQWSCGQNRTDLNYPSFTAIFSKREKSIKRKKFSRVVTNVGEDSSTYRSVLEVPNGMRIKIEPSTLTFTKRYQKQCFNVVVDIDEDATTINYGYLKWIDQHKHIVSSPIVAILS